MLILANVMGKASFYVDEDVVLVRNMALIFTVVFSVELVKQ